MILGICFNLIGLNFHFRILDFITNFYPIPHQPTSLVYNTHIFHKFQQLEIFHNIFKSYFQNVSCSFNLSLYVCQPIAEVTPAIITETYQSLCLGCLLKFFLLSIFSKFLYFSPSIK